MKKTIKTMLAGLLVVPAFALGVAALSPVTAPVAAQFDGTIRDGVNESEGSSNVPTSLFDVGGEQGIFTTIVNILLFIIGAISVIMLIFGGIRYTISGGDQSAVTAAKNTILYAIVGIIVAILAFAIVNFVLEGLLQN